MQAESKISKSGKWSTMIIVKKDRCQKSKYKIKSKIKAKLNSRTKPINFYKSKYD